MTKNKLILFLLLLVTTTSTTSLAATGGFIFEPGIGYKTETLKLTDLSQNLTTYKFSGAVGSLKIGIQANSGVSLSLVGEHSTGKAEVDPSVLEKPDYSHTLAGFQIGVSAMNTMKIYLGYAPFNSFEIKSTDSLNDFKLKGHAYQAGIMFFPFSRLGLGAQYNVNQYTEISGTQFNLGPEVDNYFDKIDSQDLSFILAIYI